MSKFALLHLKDDIVSRTPFMIATDAIRAVWKDGEYTTIWTKDGGASIRVYESFGEVRKMLMEGEDDETD